MSKPTLYRWATDEEERTNRHTSPESWVRLYDDLGEFGGLLVPVEPDYKAAINYRHMYGRPKCYDSLGEDGCECRGSVMGIVEALGIGGDDE